MQQKCRTIQNYTVPSPRGSRQEHLSPERVAAQDLQRFAPLLQGAPGLLEGPPPEVQGRRAQHGRRVRNFEFQAYFLAAGQVRAVLGSKPTSSVSMLQNKPLLFSYVPWNLHEPEKGVFDFGDAGRDFSAFLDLPRFIQMAQEEDLFVIFRPGPYVCGEWEFGGMPRWAKP